MRASRALLTALQVVFLGGLERRARKPKLEPHDAPKLEAVVVPVESAPKALTNVRARNRPA